MPEVPEGGRGAYVEETGLSEDGARGETVEKARPTSLAIECR